MSPPEILVVCGEASGDRHAADVVAALKNRHPELRFFGMGGPHLAAQGVDLLFGAHEVSVMGVTEVLPKLRRILEVMGKLKKAAARRKPVAAILVDIPDFNLRLAKSLKAIGIPVAYYISPMVWAWRPGRVKTIQKRVDQMMCILPFEEAFYARYGMHARYVGNPVVEQVPAPEEPQHFRRTLGVTADAPTLALLPGSRASEIRRCLPTLLETAVVLAGKKPGLQILIPVAPGLSKDWIEELVRSQNIACTLVDGRAAEVVGASDVAIVASGTATLEAGLMLRPLVVVYRVSFLTYWMGRLLLKVAHVALVNLLLGRRLVPELLQGDMNPHRISQEVLRLWEGPDRQETIQGLVELREKLGPKGAATRAADLVWALLQKRR